MAFSNANGWTRFARFEDCQDTRRWTCRGLWRILEAWEWDYRRRAGSWKRGVFAVSGIGHLYYWAMGRCPRGRTTRPCCTRRGGRWGNCVSRWIATGGGRTEGRWVLAE